MALKLIEGAVSELNAYLQNNMQSKLNELTSEYDDSIDLPVPAAYYTGLKSLISVPAFPAVFILGRRSQVNRYNGTFTDASHFIDIGMIIVDQDTEALQAKAYRYMRACWELVTERFFGSTEDDYYTEAGPTFAFAPTFAKGDEWITDAMLSVRVGRQEDKP